MRKYQASDLEFIKTELHLPNERPMYVQSFNRSELMNGIIDKFSRNTTWYAIFFFFFVFFKSCMKKLLYRLRNLHQLFRHLFLVRGGEGGGGLD